MDQQSTPAPQTGGPSKNTPRGRGRGRRGPFRGGREREDARAKFNPEAAKQGMERYFSEWRSEQKSNVLVYYTTDLPWRLAQPYCSQARYYLLHRRSDEDAVADSVHSVSALISFLAAKKLLNSHPASKLNDVRDFFDIKQSEAHGPAALLTILDHLGKFDSELDYVRVAYPALFIKRWFTSTLQQLRLHSSAFPEWTHDNVPNYVSNLDQWNIDKLVFPDDDSVQYIRDSAKNYLTEELKLTHQVTIHIAGSGDVPGADHVISMSNPYLDIVDDFSQHKRNVIAWIGNLTPYHPRVQQLVSAGLLTIIDRTWLERPNATLGQLDGSLPAFVRNTTVGALLEHFELKIPFYEDDDYTSPSHMSRFGDMVARAYNFLFETSMPLFQSVFHIARQPENAFGDEAQLVPIPLTQRVSKPRLDYQGNYLEMPNDPSAHVLQKIPNKALTALGLTYGFAYKVARKAVLVGRLNSGVKTIQTQYSSEDMLKYF